MADHPLLDAATALGLPELGRSVEGRPIHGGWVGSAPGSGTPTLLVFGGIHGDEPASVESVVALGQRLRAGALGGGAARVFLVPAANPDGVSAGRKNSARDVDLNRNFPARNWRGAHDPGYFPGPGPLSEPETRLLDELVGRTPLWGVVSVHAPFACVNYDGPAAAWAEAVAAACGWPARGDIGYPTPGSLGSWLGVDRGLPVLTLELPPGPYVNFAVQAAVALDTAVTAAVECANHEE